VEEMATALVVLYLDAALLSMMMTLDYQMKLRTTTLKEMMTTTMMMTTTTMTTTTRVDRKMRVDRKAGRMKLELTRVEWRHLLCDLRSLDKSDRLLEGNLLAWAVLLDLAPLRLMLELLETYVEVEVVEEEEEEYPMVICYSRLGQQLKALARQC